ncbi:hypothetical protein CAMSH0001_1452 [Campylobacter showae RM3277]|uniref:Uncharacterized protein n=1 Tax=Campylobacter showae RM3277 TaxID=553219 RepID=C6RIV5_9BACT|nr:hypothetical protein CAMSH0001_1452 [Campylobacter showae RM3277]
MILSKFWRDGAVWFANLILAKQSIKSKMERKCKEGTS